MRDDDRADRGLHPHNVSQLHLTYLRHYADKISTVVLAGITSATSAADAGTPVSAKMTL